MRTSQSDPAYDLVAALETLLPGVVIQRNLIDAAAAQYAANGYTPLTAAQALACLTAANSLDVSTLAARYLPTSEPAYAGLPAFPAALKRFPDSNPDPFDDWVAFSPAGAAGAVG